MGFAWTPWAIAPIAASVVGLGLGAFVFVTAPARPLNRALGAVLFVGGLFHSVWALANLADDPATAWAAHYLRFQMWSALIPITLLFLSTIDAPLSAPLRRVRPALVLLPILSWLAWPLWSAKVIDGRLYQGEFWTRWNAGTEASGFILLDLAALLVAVYGFAIAISQYRAAAPGPTKDRARMYAIAFGVTDAISVVLFIILTSLWWNDWAGWQAIMPKPNAADAGEAVVRFLMAAGWGLNAILFGVLFAYASLKTQLFDIDLKIKWTLSKGTVAAAFVGVFFVVSEGAQSLLSDRIGPVAGLVAAGALVFAIAPLQRAADRLADHAMPRVKDDAEYRTVRKREVYRAAVESALEEGDISEKERGMLATFASELGLTPREMHEVERETRAARAGVA